MAGIHRVLISECYSRYDVDVLVNLGAVGLQVLSFHIKPSSVGFIVTDKAGEGLFNIRFDSLDNCTTAIQDHIAKLCE